MIKFMKQNPATCFVMALFIFGVVWFGGSMVATEITKPNYQQALYTSSTMQYGTIYFNEYENDSDGVSINVGSYFAPRGFWFDEVSHNIKLPKSTLKNNTKL